MLKPDNLIFSGNIKFHSTRSFMVLIGVNMVSKKWQIVCSVKVCRLELVSLPFADKIQSNFYKLPSLEQKITKVD